jgi:threonine dehydrogenase-like Zn-dependent dehydrogenase
MTSSSGSTSTGLYGSDLHPYEVLGPFLELGDILGHEPMCVVEETGPRSQRGASRRPVVVPFNISCGTCSMCDQGLHSQCETSQVRDHGMGGSGSRRWHDDHYPRAVIDIPGSPTGCPAPAPLKPGSGTTGRWR